MRELAFDEIRLLVRHGIDWAGLARDAGRDAGEPEEFLLLLQSVADFCRERVLPRAAEVDTLGCRLEQGRVILPPPLAESLEGLKELGVFAGMTLDRRQGGFELPMTLFFLVGELLSGADSSLGLTPMLQEGVGQVLQEFAPPPLQQELIPALIDGRRLCAMGLTEPGAGSDLAAMTTRATPGGPDGTHLLEGGKIFITGGQQDVLALARAPEGIGMFHVRGEDKEVVRLERKLGLHGSPTCEIRFDRSPGRLIGPPGGGLVPCMIKLMNIARLGVAAQALGIAGRAVQWAVQYAGERVQFGVTIDRHASLRRLLGEGLLQLSASRALTYLAAEQLDRLEGLKRRAAAGEAIPAGELAGARRRAELLVPLAKLDASERAQRLCHDALQTFGGSGYTRELPLERLFRDVRITSIYEGTSQIQATQVFNEGYSAEKLPLALQLKRGQGGTPEDGRTRPFLDRLVLELASPAKVGDSAFLRSGRQTLTRGLEIFARLRGHLFQLEQQDRKGFRRAAGLYHADFAEAAAALLQGAALLRNGAHCEPLRVVAEAWLQRLPGLLEERLQRVLGQPWDWCGPGDLYEALLEGTRPRRPAPGPEDPPALGVK